MSVEAHKARMKRMLLVSSACGAIAVCAAVAAVKTDVAGLWALFALAVAAGFAAQIRFVLASAKAGRGEEA